MLNSASARRATSGPDYQQILAPDQHGKIGRLMHNAPETGPFDVLRVVVAGCTSQFDGGPLFSGRSAPSWARCSFPIHPDAVRLQLGILDEAMAETGYLVGDQFTFADINLLPILLLRSTVARRCCRPVPCDESRTL